MDDKIYTMMNTLIEKHNRGEAFVVTDYYKLLYIYKCWFGNTLAPFKSIEIYNTCLLTYQYKYRMKNLLTILDEINNN